MRSDLLIDPEPEVIPRHRRRRLAFDIQSERIATNSWSDVKGVVRC